MKKRQWYATVGVIFGVLILSGCFTAQKESNAPTPNITTNASQTESVIPSSLEETSTPASPKETTLAMEQKSVKAYVLEIGEDMLYVDLENPGSRTFEGEGEERKVAFDVGTAAFLAPASGAVGESVEITYYEEDGKNIALRISGDGVVLEPLYPHVGNESIR